MRRSLLGNTNRNTSIQAVYLSPADRASRNCHAPPGRISHLGGADIPVCRGKCGTYGRQECLPHRTRCCLCGRRAKRRRPFNRYSQHPFCRMLKVARGMLVVWFGVGLHSWSALVLLPWGMLNCIGAIYTLQHYAVNAVAGIIVAFVAVFLVRAFIALEARLGLAAPEGYGLYKSMQKDIVAVGQAVWPSVRKLVRAKTRNQSGDCKRAAAGQVSRSPRRACSDFCVKRERRRGQSHFRQPRLRRGAREDWDSPRSPD